MQLPSQPYLGSRAVSKACGFIMPAGLGLALGVLALNAVLSVGAWPVAGFGVLLAITALIAQHFVDPARRISRIARARLAGRSPDAEAAAALLASEAEVPVDFARTILEIIEEAYIIPYGILLPSDRIEVLFAEDSVEGRRPIFECLIDAWLELEDENAREVVTALFRRPHLSITVLTKELFALQKNGRLKVVDQGYP